MSYKIGIFTHTQYKDNQPVPGPADTLLEYFKTKKLSSLFFLQHSLFRKNGTVCKSFFEKKSEIVFKYDFHKNFPNFLRYFIDSILPIFFIKKFPHFDTIIAVDPLNFVLAYCFKKLGKSKSVIFYTLDYAEKRFENSFMNAAYFFLDQFALKNCDASFSAAQSICDVRKKQGLSDQKNIYLPNTPFLYGLKPKKISNIQKTNIVMVFSAPEGIDFPFVFEALLPLLNRFPKIKLTLIGRGNFKRKIVLMVRDRKLLKHIVFLNTNSHQDTLKAIRECGIGLECNDQSSAWNNYREPLKIREYMCFGLPIVSKPGHALEKEIKDKNLGFVVESAYECSKKIELLLTNTSLYSELYKKNLNRVSELDKETILNRIFFDEKVGFLL